MINRVELSHKALIKIMIIMLKKIEQKKFDERWIIFIDKSIKRN